MEERNIMTPKKSSSYQREEKTIIVTPKRGITLFLARLAAFGIVILKLVMPLSVSMTTLQVLSLIFRRKLLLAKHNWQLLFHGSFFIETIWFMLTRLRVSRLQRLAPAHIIPKLSITERRVLWDRCIKSVPSIRSFIESWFEPPENIANIHRENVEELISWALFHWHGRNWRTEMSKEENAQLDEFMHECELACGFVFKSGYDPNLKLMKFSEEPVNGQHRPLLMYGVVHTLFQRIMSPFAFAVRGYIAGQYGSLPYWYKPGANPSLPPIVFVHGIGIGLLPYQGFVKEIESRCDATDGNALQGRAVVCLELQTISQQFEPEELHSDEFVRNVRAILRIYGHDKGVFVGHSYGTFACTWLVKLDPTLVAGVGFVDPTNILLHSTDVLHNILYRKSKNVTDTVLDFIMRSEMSFEYHLRRHFFWYRNILFLEDIPTAVVPVFLIYSDWDQLVPFENALRYVNDYNSGKYIESSLQAHAEPAGKVDLVILKNADHAGFLFNAGHQTTVVNTIEALARRTMMINRTSSVTQL